MRRRLLDLIVCPACRGAFAVEVFREEVTNGHASPRVACATRCAWKELPSTAGVTPADCSTCYTRDVLEGALTCTACARRFPIIRGVPRLLEPDLLGRLRGRYPEFFDAHPDLLPPSVSTADVIGETLESFTRQRLDFHPPGPEVAHQWSEHLARNLGAAIRVEDLRDRLILDVGSGFGRHLFVASRAGAECVGIDLSGGVDVARHNNRDHPRCHLVQGNVYQRPLRDGSFDVVWSFGVLHHMPDPQGGFRAIAPFAKEGSGLVVIWVYGYRGMAFTYKLSHMRPLHRITRNMSHGVRVAASKAVAGLISGLYWEPLRLARTLGARGLVQRMPLAAYIDHDWSARVAGVHDRLSTPITFFHDRDELLGWFRDAGLTDVVVEDTNRRGWRAYGVRRTVGQAPRAVRSA